MPLPKYLEPNARDYLKNFHKRGCNNYVKPPVNVISLDQSDGKIHNLKILEIIKTLYENDIHFISQGVNNQTKKRPDLCALELEITIEIEVNCKIKPWADVTYKYNKKEKTWNIIYRNETVEKTWSKIL